MLVGVERGISKREVNAQSMELWNEWNVGPKSFLNFPFRVL